MQHCSVKVFINCRKFPTPASDWSLGCVSVLVWLLLEPTTDHHLGGTKCLTISIIFSIISGLSYC
ncbi:hypothetical protein Peur_014416 [Populus x canadensis]